jgi:RNA polymerase sigma-54 factor
MVFSAGLDQVPGLGMVPAPSLVAYAQLLALPGAELEQTVAAELAQNPALLRDEAPACGACGMPTDPPCPYCDAGAGGPRVCQTSGASGPPPGAGPASDVSWAEAMVHDLRLMVADRDCRIAEAVVASLDDRGYLTEETPDLASMAHADVTAVERVVRVLRETGPPGVGARDLRDCLLLQLDRLAAQGITHPVARAVVADHLDALARGATALIARRLGVPAGEVADARDFIRRELHPRPVPQGGLSPGDPAIVPVTPDVAVVRPAGEPAAFRVNVLEEQRMALHVDPHFRLMARGNAEMTALVRSGDFFLARLRERWTTMRRITEYVVRQRPGLVGGGPGTGKRLTRTDVAEGLGLNQSTVSRATAGRYVLLPSRRVAPYAAFFDGSLGVRSQLREIIAAEGRPLSDTELCERLQRAGHRVARRTVAKYRSRLRILPSTHR